MGLRQFWRTQKPKAIVLFTAVGLAVSSFLSVVFYSLIAPAQQQVWLFYLIVVSAWTSFFAVVWSLYGIWKYHFEIDRAKREIETRLGGNMLGEIGKILEKADRRFSDLNPRQQKNLIKLLDRGIDLAFAKAEELTANNPAGLSPPKGLKFRKTRKKR